MQRSEWNFEGRIDDDQDNVAWPEFPEERVDRFGVRTALLLLCIAFFYRGYVAGEQTKF